MIDATPQKQQATANLLEEAEDVIRLLEPAVWYGYNAVLITDADLEPGGPTIVYVNEAFTEMSGYSADEVLGKHPKFLHGDDEPNSLRQTLRHARDTGEPSSGESVNQRKDGSTYTVEWTLLPVPDHTGDVTHFVSIQRDVSELRRLEAEREELIGELRAAMTRLHELERVHRL